MRETYRILDANFNRVREALRVCEDCGRFALNDPAITAMAKGMRSDLREVLQAMPVAEFIASRDTPGDIGTEITSPTEASRRDLGEVAIAACKRLAEALRSIEEYSKFVAPGQVFNIERLRYNAYTLEQRLVGRLQVGRRFADVRLYVLVGTACCTGSVRDVARAALAGGADALQLREEDVPDSVLLALAAELRELTDETGKILLINDRADIASLVAADGLHLGQHDLPIAEARRLLRPGAIIGKSAHSLQEARAAVNEGADYVSVGPMFPTTTKDAGPVAGPELLAEAAKHICLPLVPIGGITADNVGRLLEAGAERVAVCAAVCGAADPKAAAAEIRKRLP